MSLKLAIEDLITQLKTVDDLNVITEKQEPGHDNYTLFASQGDREVTPLFGTSRTTQHIALELYVKKPSISGVAEMLYNIESAIITDRRRDGNAQTTTNTTPWTVTEDNGREGQTLISTCGVVVYES